VQEKQLLAQYLALRNSHESVYLPLLFHREFPDLTSVEIAASEHSLRSLEQRGKHDRAVKLCRQLIDRLLAGIDYYQRYQSGRLRLLISPTFLGSLATNMIIVLRVRCATTRRTTTPPTSSSSAMSRRLEAILAAALTLAWFCQRLPVHFILYYLAPVWTLYRLRSEVQRLGPLMSGNAIWNWLPLAALAVVLCETVVAAFFDRRALCVGMIIIGATFPRY
jgi:hypothetical protein